MDESTDESTDENTEQPSSPSQPFHDDILDSEIYKSDGTPRTINDDVTSNSETASNGSSEVDT
jgi:hypothetical protein